MKKWTVCCVLRTGGDYGPEHVLALKRMVLKNFTPSHDFLCLTDTYVPGVACIPMADGWPGWWGKLELFQLKEYGQEGPFAFFDLDVVLMQGFTPPTPKANELWMVKDFLWYCKRGDWNSSVMFWDSDHSAIYRKAMAKGLPWLRASFHGDQNVIKAMGTELGVTFKPVDEVVQVRSYKQAKLANEARPEGVDIVCFHGQPRPWDVSYQWVQDARTCAGSW